MPSTVALTLVGGERHTHAGDEWAPDCGGVDTRFEVMTARKRSQDHFEPPGKGPGGQGLVGSSERTVARTSSKAGEPGSMTAMWSVPGTTCTDTSPPAAVASET